MYTKLVNVYTNMADNNKTLMFFHMVLSFYNIIASDGHSRL